MATNNLNKLLVLVFVVVGGVYFLAQTYPVKNTNLSDVADSIIELPTEDLKPAGPQINWPVINEFIWFKIDPKIDVAENPDIVDLIVKAKLDEPPVVLYLQDILPKVPELDRARAVLDILNKTGNYKILEIGANGKPVFILR